MDSEAIQHYLADTSRCGAAPHGGFSGSAGGAPCGDLVRISLLTRSGSLDRALARHSDPNSIRAAGGDDAAVIEKATFDAEGCAVTRAAAAAVCELVEGEPILTAAALDPAGIADELGGLAASHRHAAELAADALHRAVSGLVGSGVPLAPAAEPEGGSTEPRDRVLVALSGGVDSAVAALLERERGMEVVAVTLKLWADSENDGERSCCSPEAVLKARRVAHSLGLPHLTLDLRGEFRAGVVQPFLDGHAAGKTPNPCVLCNGEVRIDAMIALADRVGASHLVTGHYARIADDGAGPLLAAPADAAKDQTYMLSGLRPESLARLRFPLGGVKKPEVRRLAAEAGLEVAKRPESQDLCFLAGEGKRGFLRRHGGLEEREGEVVDSDGAVLGTHRGFHGFTVGQRRGLGVAGPEPRYVLATDAATNRVVVGSHGELQAHRVRLRGTRLHRGAERVNTVRLRYHSATRNCTLEPAEDGEATIALDEPFAGAAPGQVACLMDGDLVVGHATIA
jgi:tRNA-specific 2-thiouridylase